MKTLNFTFFLVLMVTYLVTLFYADFTLTKQAFPRYCYFFIDSSYVSII